ncbi:MAG TPA: BTAD domain-containing putative transcriptional regulator, partial [Gemmatimonadales bacterium]|nr:BTAD domain-containing putative transcriptional regulator [Gemmatimonadales bacterium]
MISLRLLGPVELRVDGEPPPAELLWRKHLALLVYLARSPRGRARDHLIGMFWPDKDDARARHSLNEALRVLRRALGEALHTEGDVVRVDAGAVTLDLDAPENAVGGVFLEGFSVPDAPAFEDWVAGERAALRGASLDLLNGRGEALLACGDIRAAREAAARAVALDPCHEPSARLLMRTLALAGDRPGALDAYAHLARRLKDDLDAEPATETIKLAELVRTGARAWSAAGGRGMPRRDATPEAGAARAGSEPVPLVGPGRDVLAGLVKLWTEVVNEVGVRCAVLRGDPGTGKSRLADELAARARLDGGAVCLVRALGGEGTELGTGEPPDGGELWGAWAGALAVADLGGAPPEALAGLAVFHPDIAVRFPGARTASPFPPLEAVVASMGAGAAERPMLLVLDDADRAPPEMVRLPLHLSQRAPGARVLALWTVARPGSSAVDDLVARVGRDVPGRVLDTTALAEPDVADLVAWALPRFDRHAADRLIRRVLADTAGNPFLAVEVVRAVKDGLAVPGADRVWPAQHRTLDDTLPTDLPGMVIAALRQRYRSLSPQAQRA